MKNIADRNINNDNLKYHILETVKLAFPVSVGQLGHIMLGVVDSFMVGKLGATSLASAALANGLFFLIMVLGIGLSHAITALVAIARGENKTEECGIILRQALLVNIVFSILLTILTFGAAKLVQYLNQDYEVALLTQSYLEILSISILPFMVFQTYRQFVEGLSNTKPPMYVALIANIVNIFGNWVFIYGNLGVKSYGLDGAGYSTLITRIFMSLIMVLIVVKSNRYKKFNPGLKFNKIDWRIIKRIVNIGLPSGLMYSMEVGAFALAAVIIGWLGSIELAAHQIAINLASISYMVVLGISAAATIRVGNALGKKNLVELKLASKASIILSVSFMFFTGTIFVLFNKVLPRLYIGDITVIELASQLLYVAALFQLSDGIQAVVMGMLKGITDVRIPMIITFIAYWVIALPTGYLLGFVFKLHIVGIWLGLFLGLTVAGTLFLVRFYYQIRKIKFSQDEF